MTMIRRTLAIGILLALTVSAAAQETTLPLLRTIMTPFYGPVIEVSPDGTLLAVHENQIIVSNEDAAEIELPILLIDLETGGEIGRLEGVQTDLARGTAFSPDGTQLASYHVNGDLIIWDIATQKALQVYDWLPLGGSYIDYMPDGQTLILVQYNSLLGQHVLFDLATGSITDMLGLRPDTFAQLNDQASDTLSMGVYSIAAQTVGPNGELYGASGNGDVYRWDTETRLRELIYPASDERPLRFSVRGLQALDDGSLAFLDNNIDTLVVFDPDGIRTDYPLNGQKFALSEGGIAISTDIPEGGLFLTDLNTETPEAVQLLVDLGTDEEGEPIELRGDPMLAFAANGDLIVGGIYDQGGEGAVYIFDLP